MTSLENGFYYHYKHDPEGDFNKYSYEVFGLSRNTETEELGVLYRPLYENKYLAPAGCFVRPLNMFTENVKVDDGERPRFEKVTDPELIKRLSDIKTEMYG